MQESLHILLPTRCLPSEHSSPSVLALTVMQLYFLLFPLQITDHASIGVAMQLSNRYPFIEINLIHDGEEEPDYFVDGVASISSSVSPCIWEGHDISAADTVVILSHGMVLV